MAGRGYIELTHTPRTFLVLTFYYANRLQVKGRKVVNRRSSGLALKLTNLGDAVRRQIQIQRWCLVAVWVGLATLVGTCATTLVEVDQGALKALFLMQMFSQSTLPFLQLLQWLVLGYLANLLQLLLDQSNPTR